MLANFENSRNSKNPTPSHARIPLRYPLLQEFSWKTMANSKHMIFGHVTKVRILWAVLYFTDQLFSTFYRFFCKIANLWDIDLKYQGSFLTSVVTILQNFVKLACLEVAFLKIGFFGILVCNLPTSQVMSKFFCDFVPPHWAWHLVKMSW